jgi:hypothetical protein
MKMFIELKHNLENTVLLSGRKTALPAKMLWTTVRKPVKYFNFLVTKCNKPKV